MTQYNRMLTRPTTAFTARRLSTRPPLSFRVGIGCPRQISALALRAQVGRPQLHLQALRPISSSSSYYNEQTPTSFPDPSRPDLFYHLVTPPTSPTSLSATSPVFAVSFLPTPPPTSDSSTIIGWVPAGEESGLNDFVENPKFRAVLHEAIQQGLKEDIDDVQRNGAMQLGEGWMHVHDDRNIPALGRIGDIDDIIASVLVEGGKMKPETYQPMPAYRLVTSDGVTQLTPGLKEKLRVVLEGVAQRESEPR
ncbi:hypothetical protein Moror_7570 [Moniliophthora roreri MCA 2997]|uniref:Uncharacterized protein n=1 Tax=Moniliophthora roreri (strain MCA 2997) TaxID=1381753 RepID=V2WUM9_MONRO|nr:hypothetical protein Moror_7570 [Moniliophthora roreri MCA 2997]